MTITLDRTIPVPKIDDVKGSICTVARYCQQIIQKLVSYDHNEHTRLCFRAYSFDARASCNASCKTEFNKILAHGHVTLRLDVPILDDDSDVVEHIIVTQLIENPTWIKIIPTLDEIVKQHKTNIFYVDGYDIERDGEDVYINVHMCA